MRSQTRQSVLRLHAVPFTRVTIEDQLWAKRLKAHREATIPACLDQCEVTGRIANFEKAAGRIEGQFEGIFFNDSDVYKVLEGVAYSLMTHPDTELERKADEIIEKIAAAQQADGYLFTYYTLKDEGARWTDMSYHEMYCGGHLIEAAVAYKQATGKRTFLDVACKLADHYDSLFGPGKRHWVPGHEEIELALVKLYRETSEERYLHLAEWLLEERGHGHGKGEIWNKEDWGPAYCQDDVPIRDMSNVSGHAVRAMYLYTAVADVAALTGDVGYIQALDRLWDSVIGRNMYITGGIGPSKFNEGFTEDYDMPNDTAYCETCASVGMVYWNHRMNLLHGDAKYADVVERALYNGSLAGVSLSGDKFFYVNPLTSDGTHHRVAWYDCSCCPTQIARFIPSIGNYVYATSSSAVWVNQYLAGQGTLELGDGERVGLRQTTNYPWDGRVTITVESTTVREFSLNLRMPGWCESATLQVNGQPVNISALDKGYVRIERTWQAGDSVLFDMDMPVERVHAHPNVKANIGKVALQRGPLVYCVEEADQENDIFACRLSSGTKLLHESRPDLLHGVTVVHLLQPEGQRFTAIPYYSWDNRSAGRMAVWLDEG